MRKSTQIQGKYVVFSRTERDDAGKPKEFHRWSPDASEMLKTGEYVEDPADAGKSRGLLRREAIDKLLEREGLQEIDANDEGLVAEIKRLRDENKKLRNQVDDDDQPPEVDDDDPLSGTIKFGQHSGTSWADLVASHPDYVRQYVVQKGRVEGKLLELLTAATTEKVAETKVAPKRERKPRKPKG